MQAGKKYFHRIHRDNRSGENWVKNVYLFGYMFVCYIKNLNLGI